MAATRDQVHSLENADLGRDVRPAQPGGVHQVVPGDRRAPLVKDVMEVI